MIDDQSKSSPYWSEDERRFHVFLEVHALSCYQCSMRYTNEECNANNSTYATECQPTFDTCVTIVLKPGKATFFFCRSHWYASLFRLQPFSINYWSPNTVPNAKLVNVNGITLILSRRVDRRMKVVVGAVWVVVEIETFAITTLELSSELIERWSSPVSSSFSCHDRFL